MSIISDSLKRIKPSPTLAVTQKARELKAAGIPAALSSLAFWVTAKVGEGFILLRLSDIMLIEI